MICVGGHATWSVAKTLAFVLAAPNTRTVVTKHSARHSQTNTAFDIFCQFQEVKENITASCVLARNLVCCEGTHSSRSRQPSYVLLNMHAATLSESSLVFFFCALVIKPVERPVPRALFARGRYARERSETTRKPSRHYTGVSVMMMKC